MSDRENKSLLLVHAFSGCNSVSAVYGFGIVKFSKLIANRSKIPEDNIQEFMKLNTLKATIQHKRQRHWFIPDYVFHKLPGQSTEQNERREVDSNKIWKEILLRILQYQVHWLN